MGLWLGFSVLSLFEFCKYEVVSVKMFATVGFFEK